MTVKLIFHLATSLSATLQIFLLTMVTINKLLLMKFNCVTDVPDMQIPNVYVKMENSGKHKYFWKFVSMVIGEHCVPACGDQPRLQ